MKSKPNANVTSYMARLLQYIKNWIDLERVKPCLNLTKRKSVGSGRSEQYLEPFRPGLS